MESSSGNILETFLTSDTTLIAFFFLGMEPAILEHFISKKHIYTCLKNNKYTKHFKPDVMQKIMHSIYSKEFSGGSLILGEKNEERFMFLVEKGEFVVYEKNAEEAVKGVTGRLYGEEEILIGFKKLTKVIALTDCKVWMLTRKVLKIILRSSGENMKESDILKNFHWFKNIDDERISKIADAVVLEHFGTQETVKIKYDTLYIISNGSVRITQEETADQTKEIILQVLSRGDHFEGNTESSHKIVAFFPGVELLTINMEILHQLLGQNFRQEIVPLPKYKNQGTYADIELKDLEAIARLGKGNFGKVELVRCSKDPEDIKLFALKVLEKHRTVRIHQQSHVIDERGILLSCENPFIIRLYKTFRDDRYIYMLFEACLGGQVWDVLMKNGFFKDNTARFIAASAVEALDYLHRKQIIYRDLKTDNMVIDQNGYIKMVDFGLSKHLGFTGRSWTFCGTPCNMAPEVILNIGHDRAVDFWAMGLLIYELLCGCTIFSDWNPKKAYEEIIGGIENIKLSHHIVGRTSEDLVKKLCTGEPTDRLGYRDINDIRKHRWFEGFDWNALISRTMTPPKCIIPSSKNYFEFSKFEQVDEDNKNVPLKDESNWDYIFE